MVKLTVLDDSIAFSETVNGCNFGYTLNLNDLSLNDLKTLLIMVLEIYYKKLTNKLEFYKSCSCKK